MAHDKEIKRLRKKAEAQGWTVDKTTRGHWRFKPKDKSVSPAVTSGTPSDWRSWKNFKADLKREGFKFDGLAAILCVGGRADPSLWEQAKEAAKRAACRRSAARCGTWDARMAQDAGRIYREKGGQYCGPRTVAQRSLSKWTKEDWRTESGEAACRKVNRFGRCADRYLPASAWAALSPKERRATQRAKKAGRGQFVPNAPAAKAAGRRARRAR